MHPVLSRLEAYCVQSPHRQEHTTGDPTDITGAASLVRALEKEGIDTVFGLVGHGNLTFVDALQDSDTIDYVSVYHEQVAAHAADAYFRASGRVSVVTTTVGPGFTNLMTGLGDAMLDSSAMVVIAGGMPSAYVGKEPLQELSYSIDNAQLDIARPLTKRIILATGAKELANQFHRAVRYALTGCPGPVVLQVPLDFFSEWVAPSVATLRPTRSGRSGPDYSEVEKAVDLIAQSERPLIFAGGGAVLSRSSAALTHLADRFGLPVASTMSGQAPSPRIIRCPSATQAWWAPDRATTPRGELTCCWRSVPVSRRWTATTGDRTTSHPSLPAG